METGDVPSLWHLKTPSLLYNSEKPFGSASFCKANLIAAVRRSVRQAGKPSASAIYMYIYIYIHMQKEKKTARATEGDRSSKHSYRKPLR